MIDLIPNFNIAVKPLYDSDYTASGRLIIPDIAKERCDQGLVKYIGRKVPEGIIAIGDHVLFSGYTGTLMNLQDEGDLIIFHYKFAVCKIYDHPIMVPNLYFKTKDGSYITTTYEFAIGCLSDAYDVRRAKILNKLESRDKEYTSGEIDNEDEN